VNDSEKQPTHNKPKPTFFAFIHLGVCFCCVIYYLLKFSGIRLLTRDGEFIFDTILVLVVAVNLIITLNKKKPCKIANKEEA
jgi:hypothetical protein